MPKKIEEKMHILCPTRAYLYPVSLMGPIVHPLHVTKSTAVSLLMTGAEVHEYDPATKKTVKLTLENINKENRFETTAPAPVEPTPVAPVVKSGVSVTPVVPEPAPAVEEPVVEETPVEETVEVAPVVNPEDPTSIAAAVELVIAEDGTVDETSIDWSGYTKNVRKALRTRINEINATASLK